MVLSVLCVASCSTLRPLPVKEPKSLAEADTTLHGLGNPQNLAGAKSVLYGYANAYTKAAEDLYAANYTAADATFGGGVLGMIGGLTKSPETALIGAALSGASGISAQRYAFQIQANNYEGAAQAMECMADVLAYAKEHEVDFLDLNYRVNDVRRKLRKNQAKIDIASADTSALQAALKAQLDAIEAKKKAEQALAIARGNKNLASFQVELALATQEVEDKTRELNRANLLKCVTAY